MIGRLLCWTSIIVNFFGRISCENRLEEGGAKEKNMTSILTEEQEERNVKQGMWCRSATTRRQHGTYNVNPPSGDGSPKEDEDDGEERNSHGRTLVEAASQTSSGELFLSYLSHLGQLPIPNNIPHRLPLVPWWLSWFAYYMSLHINRQQTQDELII